MKHNQLKNINIKVARDEYGYLISLADWNQNLAKELAKEESIDLSFAHWEIINFVHRFYLEFNISPTVRMLVQALTKQYGPEYGNSRYLFRLFPKGPAKQATKIAGLPKPVRCL
ncbi:TusE/DsrC/DsvC family sulfur relay protein [Candidatus Erwinia haradaeae]|uniref:Sulfurtransferase n=1 Tax=Candidatus Erwinia haradaeae TaxID=1922217 RepID=A0A451DLU0_9GAMM|nr:TusE/DsrC/DsvC family sulfur relay protein [Candidatus Erwinia haradaeae]VFP87701.1 Sulfurtransferase TusE [Candidatus Erwinia haradaeae]